MPIKEFFTNLAAKPGAALKIFGLSLVAIIVLAFAWRIVESTFQPLFQYGNRLTTSSSPSRDEYYDSNAEEMAGGSVAMQKYDMDTAIAPEPPQDGGTIGGDAEEYEVTEHNATIKTQNLDATCTEIEKLKGREEIVFENANRYEQGCNYTFKVENAFTQEILATIEELNPDTLSANTYTIKRMVESYTNELEILQQKMTSIDETFESAKDAYAEIEMLARNTRDAESLATVIDSKVQMIERLTQQRINVSEQLNRMQRAMAEQLDRIDYTRFYITVQEDKFVDGKAIKDSWKTAVKEFVRDCNEIVQDVSVGLITLVLTILQYVLYFFILLIVAKYGWKGARAVWRK
ncbi:MAG: hypothetical protein WCX61_01580 [Candidatus Peribacteraceae bacterium]